MEAHWAPYALTAALKYVTNTTPTAAPTAFYLRLSSTTADPLGTWTELTVTNYAAQALTWNYGGSYFAVNTADVNFTNLGAGSVIGQGIWDAATGGHLLWWADLDNAFTFASGRTISYLAGTIKVGLSS